MSDDGTNPGHGTGPSDIGELARLNRALRMLSNSNQTLIHVTDEAGLVNGICRIVVETGGYVMATIVLAMPDAARTPRVVAHAGPADGGASLAFATRAMARGEMCLVRDIEADADAAAWRDEARRCGWQAVIALPLRGGPEIFGALCIHAAADAFDADEIDILAELASDLAFGIDTLRARAAHQRAEDDLHKAQQVFRSLVENSRDAIARYDRECRRTYVSPAFIRITGMAEEALLGVTPTGSPPLDPENAAELEQLLRKVLASGVAGSMDIRSAGSGGTGERWFNLEAFPEFDRQGQVVGVMSVARDITARKHVEQTQRAHLHFFECMDRINRAMQQTTDLDRMMRDTLDVVLSIFDCDRALLVWPCDPAAAAWQVPMESTHPEYPGALARHMVIPMSKDVADNMRFMLAADGPVRMGAGGEIPLPPEVAGQFSLRSVVSQVIRPRLGPPWLFVVHQCSRDRIWSDDEIRLLREIGRRLADGLSNLLMMRDLRESEGRLRTLVQTIPDLVWLKDAEGVYLDCNPRFERFFGASAGEVIGRKDSDFVAADLAESFRENDRKAIAAGQPNINEEWLTFPDNGYRGLFETIKTPMRDATGRLIGVLGIARDITARHESEEQLRIAATAFEAQEGIMIADADKTVLRVNRAYTEITGYTAAEVVGRQPNLLSSGQHDADFYKAMWDSIGGSGSWQGEIWNRRKSGELFPVWLTITAVRNEQGETTHYIGMLTDISARKTAEAEIERLAFYDPLTHLPNRRLLVDRLQRALLGSARSRLLGALLFIDLDNFKLLNDTQGHDIGDQLLIKVAKRLGECVRGGDTVARLGGDEFVIILEDLSDNREEAAARALGIGEKILAALNRSYLIAGRAHHSTPSVGATLFLAGEGTVDELLKQADIAMYQAKASGRNTLRFFDPDMQRSLASRAALETAMRHGIEERQFELYFQPQVGRGIVVGAEALLRWRHPEHGLMLPGQFIPLAEETGLILPIGEWILRTACARLRAWMDDARTRELQLAINVSARQFRQPDFVARVRRALDGSGAPAARLKLELTESLVLDDVTDSIEKMRALKKLGVGFALDDFGTGYSSLSYLTLLPLDQLKIDQSFVRNLPDSANDAAVVQTIITLGRSLGMAVIAEGVETEAQRSFLEAHGCPTWQGYLFSRPVELARFMRVIDAVG